MKSYALSHLSDQILLRDLATLVVRDHVHTAQENFLCGPGCDAGATGGVFAVCNDKVQAMFRPQQRHERLHRPASGFTHDVANEKNFHTAKLNVTFTKHTQEIPPSH